MADSAQSLIDLSPEPDLAPDRDDVLLGVPRWDCRSSLCASCTQMMEHTSRMAVLCSKSEPSDNRSENDLECAAAQGCFLCARVMAVLRAYVQGGGDLPSAEERLVSFSTNAHKTKLWLHIWGEPEHFSLAETFSVNIDVLQTPNDYIPRGERSRPGLEEGFSKERIRQLRHWYQNCLQNHEKCKRYRAFPTQNPSNVLCLEDGDMVKLKSYESASQDGAVEYVSLSHRWGDPAKGHRIPPKLTRDDGKDARLRQGIKVSSLPKTFRDAVLITRTLGLRYLWIDSLCIFQDSAQDWLDEASKMGDIYAGGVFNIAATGSSSSDGGCLFRGDDPRWIPAFQATETNKPQSDEGTWIELHDHEPVKEDIFSSELFKRGWVHQELHLSPAVLHCTQRQLYWVCTEGVYSERYPQVISKDGPFLSDELRTDVKSLLLSSLREGNELKTVNVWLHLVEQYSEARLTKPEDKQIAIRGLQSKMTETFNRERQAHFMAGTWMASWLVEQLCWMPNTELETCASQLRWDPAESI
ncbi:uncharacterized protein E0L32_001305 [Thyridium curvatum]|uniref:Heterokaryon incompatibility domain-containing protein n=1 Tax=Thyridium curvatum TaxID=1093900 RepID=A0A507AZ80_9PEZI|nr:uncharacterized protein E0L32_001305 [Thyridium curvatum]TPX10108.1 hypothetical protein E0L32_001305 [Thyridium curvatum]